MPIGLYFHIPYCAAKCRYCDFVSAPGSRAEQSQYVQSLLREMQGRRGVEADSVFIGGGTPSILPPPLLEALLRGIRESFRLTEDCEFTMEANPKTLDAQKLTLLREYGVNRLSIGVQSFDDGELKRLGRIHNSREAAETVTLARGYIPNINLDLMTGIPGQTMESLKSTLETAVSLEPAHLSCYSLIIEEGTPFFDEWEQNRLELPSEDEDREMYWVTGEFLERRGWKRYEISNYAKEGRECCHNLKYWGCREYLGFGAAAHSYLGNRRFYHTASRREYMAAPTEEIDEEILTPADAMGEFMIMGLRLIAGVEEKEFERRFQEKMTAVYGEPLKRLCDQGLLRHWDGRYSLTERGLDLANRVMAEFV